MESIDLLDKLSEIMEAHDVPFHTENEWVVPYGKLPAVRATWYPREHNGVLEVDVLLEDERIINECFAGIGAGEKAINDAIQNFCVNSFHVFLAAFWQLNDSEQVTTEEWKIGSKSYTAYVGNFGTRGSEETSPEIPENLFKTIEKIIQNEAIKDKVSWFRCFFCDVSGEHTFEALKNNEVWESGLGALKSLPWKESNGYYSVRNFLVLKEHA